MASPSAKERYNLTQQDEDRAKRIKTIYQQKKAELGITQQSLGEILGMSQSNVAKYLNGDMPMSLETVMKFAKVLGIEPLEIEPDLDRRFQVLTIASNIKIGVLGTQSGRLTDTQTVTVKGTGYMNHHMAILVDTKDMEPIIHVGARLIVDPHRKIRTGDDILVQYRKNGVQVPYSLIERNDEGITVMAFIMKPSVKKKDLKHPEWFPTEEQFIPYKEIGALRYLYAHEMR